MLLLYWAIFIVLSCILIGLLAFGFFTLLYILPMFKGAVYVPSNPLAIRTMIQLAQLKPGTKVADLGSGDGRVVIAFAQAGAEAHGYETNPLLVWRSNRAIKKAHLEGKAFIHLQSYWDVSLAPYQVITVYGITYIMADLERKFKQELRRGARVISNHFTFPTWKQKQTKNNIRLYQK